MASTDFWAGLPLVRPVAASLLLLVACDGKDGVIYDDGGIDAPITPVHRRNQQHQTLDRGIRRQNTRGFRGAPRAGQRSDHSPGAIWSRRRESRNHLPPDLLRRSPGEDRPRAYRVVPGRHPQGRRALGLGRSGRFDDHEERITDVVHFRRHLLAELRRADQFFA